jgi:glycopeptide antibiotics resistance protein
MDMRVKNKTALVLLWALLLVCLVVLARYIVLKQGPYYDRLNQAKHLRHRTTLQERWDKANLTPFKTIQLFNGRNVAAKARWRNIGGNILGFLPIGFLFPLLMPFLRNFFATAGAVLLLSLFFEVTQLYTGLGIFDVDDLILNTTGGMLGWLLFWTAGRLLKTRRSVPVIAPES